MHKFEQIFNELDCSKTLGGLRTDIYDKTNGMLESAPLVGLLALKANLPLDNVNKSCCTALANYICNMI